MRSSGQHDERYAANDVVTEAFSAMMPTPVHSHMRASIYHSCEPVQTHRQDSSTSNACLMIVFDTMKVLPLGIKDTGTSRGFIP
jgi:hypothetical protein